MQAMAGLTHSQWKLRSPRAAFAIASVTLASNAPPVGELVPAVDPDNLGPVASALERRPPPVGIQWLSEEADTYGFPVPVPPGPQGAVLFVRVRFRWARNTSEGLCVAAVESPAGCNERAFPQTGCLARPLWRLSDPSRFLGFEVRRPRFVMEIQSPVQDHSHSICLRYYSQYGSTQGSLAYTVLGNIVYYPLPRVNASDAVQRIGVRTFLNPGWKQEFNVDCKNCSSLNRISVRPIPTPGNCAPVAGPTASAVAAIRGQLPHSEPLSALVKSRGQASPCAPPFSPDGPCGAYFEDSFDTGSFLRHQTATTEHPEKAVFSLYSSRRLSTRQRRDLFHRRSVVCFYPDEARPRGWIVGYVEFHMDGPDVQAFVGFVCFFGIALPLICMVTVLLHVNKHQRCHQHVQELRLQYQREQLERELGSPRHDSPSGSGRASGSRGNNALPLVSPSAVGMRPVRI